MQTDGTVELRDLQVPTQTTHHLTDMETQPQQASAYHRTVGCHQHSWTRAQAFGFPGPVVLHVDGAPAPPKVLCTSGRLFQNKGPGVGSRGGRKG
jgi:hypothetical protein